MRKVENPFKNITFDTSPVGGKRGYVPVFKIKSKEDLLSNLAEIIASKEKQKLKNHTFSSVKAKVEQIKAGKKIRKLFNTDVHPIATKTSLRNQTEIALFTADQSLNLLKKLQKYVEAEKSPELDINKFNEFAKEIHEGYQNKVTELALKKELEILNKKKVKKGENQEISQRIENALKDVEKHKAQMKEYNKKHPKLKSTLTKVLDLATEPLFPALKSNQITKTIRENSTVLASDKPKPSSAISKSKHNSAGITRA